MEPFEQDLPADAADASLIAYLQQMLANRGSAESNPKKLVGLVALFANDEPRLLAAPGLNANDYPPRAAGAPIIDKPQAIIREDLFSVTSYIDFTSKTCQWVIVGGKHKIIC